MEWTKCDHEWMLAMRTGSCKKCGARVFRKTGLISAPFPSRRDGGKGLKETNQKDNHKEGK